MRLIDADAVYNKAVENHRKGETEDWELDSIINYLDGAPTLNVETNMRCKDCAHFGKLLRNGFHACCLYVMSYCRPDDFCSRGVRKDV